MVVNYWRDGAYYPHGGIQAIPNALCDAVEAAGGSVVAGAAVGRILVAGGRATGVEPSPADTASGRAGSWPTSTCRSW